MENLEDALLDSLSLKHGKDLDNAIRLLQLNEIKNSALEIKQKCLLESRCPVCTLPLTCIHFHIIPSQPKASPISLRSITPSPKSNSKKSFYKSLRFLNSQQSQKYDLIIHQPHKHQLSQTKKQLELKRLQVLNSNGKFKQEKLQTKIEEIEKFQEKQKKIEKSLRIQSEKRKKYFEEQKEKIKIYNRRVREMIFDKKFDFKRCTNYDSMFRVDSLGTRIKIGETLTSLNKFSLKAHQKVIQDTLENSQQINT